MEMDAVGSVWTSMTESEYIGCTQIITGVKSRPIFEGTKTPLII